MVQFKNESVIEFMVNFEDLSPTGTDRYNHGQGTALHFLISDLHIYFQSSPYPIIEVDLINISRPFY